MHRRLQPVVLAALMVAATVLVQGTVNRPRASAQAAPPTITQITPTYSSAAGGTSVTILGTNFSTDAGGTQFTDDGENPLFSSVTCTSSTECTATSLAMQAGEQSAFVGEVYAMVGDAMSNAGLQFVWYGQPVITKLSPSSARAGTVVTLHGGVFPSKAPFGGPVSIKFGDTTVANVACPNIDECWGQAPPGTGTVQVTITTPGGTSAGIPFTYSAPGLGSPELPSHPGLPHVPNLPAFPEPPAFPASPGGATPLAVTGITPNYGPAAGGTPVTISGAGFSMTPGATKFAAGGQNQFTSVSCVSTTRCTAVAPAVSVPAGSILFGESITVTVGSQLAQNQDLYFAWYGTPQLTKVQPSSGPSAGGTTVTLTGGVFPSPGRYPGPISVYFGTRSATNVSCNADGSACTAVSPPGSGTVQVTVSTPGGTSNGLPFTYATLVGLPDLPGLSGASTPVVAQISPNYGPSSAKTNVVITGSGFSTTPGATQFGESISGGIRFTDVVCQSGTRCTAIAPAVSVFTSGALSANVVAFVNGRMSSGNPAVLFTWYGKPELTSISPTSGPASGGTTVTLKGGAFPGNSLVTISFGTTASTSINCNPAGNSCTAVAPPGSGTVPVTVITPGGTSNARPFTYTGGGTGSSPASIPSTIPGFPTLPLPSPNFTP